MRKEYIGFLSFDQEWWIGRSDSHRRFSPLLGGEEITFPSRFHVDSIFCMHYAAAGIESHDP